MGLIERPLFIEIQDIKNNTEIDDNVSDMKIQRSLIEVQNTMLQKVLGSTLFEKMSEDIKNDTLTNQYLTLLKEKIHEYLLAAIELKIPKKLNIKYTENGLLTKDIDHASKLQYNESEAVRKENLRVTTFYGQLITEYLKANLNKFPEYAIEDKSGIKAQDTIFNSPFVFVDDEI
ncbi:hypothetical protein EV201_1264 [Ancylomarina subtilis]|uniref:Uncharacterized protein n=1 Tax=Ancylomarina subtilis TaxID=1639035 RepID=A0A4Q7VK89_9BACT|nr:hypothetical protein [Ancylomarina subtilis]RZT96623.1 hypothetical protein EV201_1264 [Ancylomarina subtilis]